MGQAAHHYQVFETASGFCGIAWNGVGITHLRLPTKSAETAERGLQRRVPGAVRDVLVRPEHPYTMALLAADPHAIIDFEGTTRLASIPGQVPLPGSWTSGCRFAQRCRFAQEQCRTTIPLLHRAEGEGGVRCVRRDEVLGRQDEWRRPVTIGGQL